jgi:hypothetical protein
MRRPMKTKPLVVLLVDGSPEAGAQVRILPGAPPLTSADLTQVASPVRACHEVWHGCGLERFHQCLSSEQHTDHAPAGTTAVERRAQRPQQARCPSGRTAPSKGLLVTLCGLAGNLDRTRNFWSNGHRRARTSADAYCAARPRQRQSTSPDVQEMSSPLEHRLDNHCHAHI